MATGAKLMMFAVGVLVVLTGAPGCSCTTEVAEPDTQAETETAEELIRNLQPLRIRAIVGQAVVVRTPAGYGAVVPMIVTDGTYPRWDVWFSESGDFSEDGQFVHSGGWTPPEYEYAYAKVAGVALDVAVCDADGWLLELDTWNVNEPFVVVVRLPYLRQDFAGALWERSDVQELKAASLEFIQNPSRMDEETFREWFEHESRRGWQQ